MPIRFISFIASTLASLIVLHPALGNEAEAQHWYRCNTHTHTRGADVNATAEFVAEWYKSNGYQCLVITDHEFLTDVAPLNERVAGEGEFLVLPGQEITQVVADPAHRGGVRHAHVNGINTDRVIMPLGPADAQKGGLGSLTAPAGVSMAKTFVRNVAEIDKAGGIPQINHPNISWSVRLEDLMPIDRPFLMEVWNAFPASNNLGGTDDAGNRGPSTEELWDALLSRGKVVWGVASDDAHEYRRIFQDRENPTPGKGWIVIQASSLTAPLIVESLRRGRFYASTGLTLEHYSVDRTGIRFEIVPPRGWNPALPSARYTTRFIGENGRVLTETMGKSPQYRFRGDEKYVRASIIDSDGRRAWTQPVFLDERRARQAGF